MVQYVIYSKLAHDKYVISNKAIFQKYLSYLKHLESCIVTGLFLSYSILGVILGE